MLPDTAAPTRFGLRDALWQRITAALLRHPGVEAVVLFGSRAKGTHRPGSDIDLAVQGPTLTVADELTLKGWLDDLDLPWFFDLVRYDDLAHAPDLRAHIARVGQVLARRGDNAR